MKSLAKLLFWFASAAALPGCSRPQPDLASAPADGDTRVSQDRQLVDDYLAKWDRFAQGENQLVPEVRDNKAGFEAALTRLLAAGDRRAPARMVFYPVVQVGGGIPTDSELGKASAAVLGPDFPVTNFKGQRVYFCGDLYLWWEANREKYEAFPLFDEWSKRDFAQTSVIPMYRQMAERK